MRDAPPEVPVEHEVVDEVPEEPFYELEDTCAEIDVQLLPWTERLCAAHEGIRFGRASGNRAIGGPRPFAITAIKARTRTPRGEEDGAVIVIEHESKGIVFKIAVEQLRVRSQFQTFLWFPEGTLTFWGQKLKSRVELILFWERVLP